MNIDVTALKNRSVKELEINETCSFKKDQLSETELLDLKDVVLSGIITLDVDGDYIIDADLNGTMILPCAVTLKEVPYQFSTKIEGNIEKMLAEIDENYEKSENTIDIFPIIWENILMEIPLRVVSEDLDNVSLEGDGWKFISDNNERVETTNPELEKLKDLL